MDTTLIAAASIAIQAPASRVWQALVTPTAVKQYMFGTDVVSDWRTGSAIVWKGEWQGKAYEDKGVIVTLEPEHRIQYTHFSPLAGLPDSPENYHTVTIELAAEDGGTRVTLTQDNNPDESARAHSEQNWSMMLAALKKFIER